MKLFHFQYISRTLLFIFFLAGIAACKKDGAIALDQPDNGDAAVSITDTFTVKSSTLLLDSLPTAGNGVLLIGRINDPELGNTIAGTYFPIAPSGLDMTSFPDDARLDSIRLKLTYNGYYYGDTSVNQTISVHQLTEKINYKPIPGYLDPEEQNVFSGDATFYNRSVFNYNMQTLGSLTFKPKPKSAKNLLIPLPDALGNTLLSMIKNSDTRMLTSADFIDYFKGLTLVADQNIGNAVIGYTDSAAVRLYYTFSGDNGLPEKAEVTFNIIDKSFQFNNITSNRSSTLLKNIQTTKSVPASQVNGKSYIQAGTGMVTKLEFPSINYLVGASKVAINKAELILESPYGSDRPFDLPPQLIVLLANQNNKPIKQYSETYSGTTMDLVKGEDIGSKNSYRFILTEYINDYIKKYNGSSLLISLPIENLKSSVNRLVLGSQGNTKAQIKLKITYTKFN